MNVKNRLNIKLCAFVRIEERKGKTNIDPIRKFIGFCIRDCPPVVLSRNSDFM